MATFTAGINTNATGPLNLAFILGEERAQDIFAMLLGTSAPITREREVPDPTEENPNQTRTESYQDSRGLGECLVDEITIFIRGIESRAIDYKKHQAATAAAAEIPGDITVTPMTP